ncbi:hypothetical protein LTR81_024401, partial [Elasticomyces elasticus]
VKLNGQDGRYKGFKCYLAVSPSDPDVDVSAFQAAADALEQLLDAKVPADEPVEDENKALSIILQQDGDSYQWLFCETERGQAAGCNSVRTVVFASPTSSNVDINRPPFPSGDCNINIWGRACKWRGSGEGPVVLICDDKEYACAKVGDDAPTSTCPAGTTQHEGAYCDFHSDGPGTAPTLQPDPTCGICLWSDSPADAKVAGKTKLRVNDAWDQNGTPIGGAWGNEKAGDIIGDGDEIRIKSKLPKELVITVRPYEGDGHNTNYEKSFHFKYGGQEWNDEDRDKAKPHCDRTQRDTTAHSGRFKPGWSCFFAC